MTGGVDAASGSPYVKMAGEILDELFKVGALKEPPNPKEMWVTKNRAISTNKLGGEELDNPRVLFFEPQDFENWWHVMEVEK